MGDAPRPVVASLQKSLGNSNTLARLPVNGFLQVQGRNDMWAIGDCANTKYAPLATVASQQGAYLAHAFNDSAEILFDRALPSHQLIQSKSSVVPPASKITQGIKPFEFRSYLSQYADKPVSTIDKSADDKSFSMPPYWLYRSAFASRLFSVSNRATTMVDTVKSLKESSVERV